MSPGYVAFAGRALPGPDGAEPTHFLISEVAFDDMAAVELALASPEMAAALDDVPNFAPDGVTIILCDTEDLAMTDGEG